MPSLVLKRALKVFFIFSIFALCLLFYFIHKNNRYITSTSNWVEHTNEVILKIDKILSLAKGIDANAKGYLLTGDSNYIIRLNKAEIILSAALIDIKNLTVNNPIQQQRLEEANQLINENLRFRKEVILLRQEKGFEDANHLFRTGISTRSIAKLETHFALIEAADKQLLAERKASNQSAVKTYTALIILLEAVILTILAVGFTTIYLSVNKRMIAEAELKKNNHFIEGLIHNTTHLITIRDLEGKYILVNSPVLKLYGRKEEEIIGKSSYDLLPLITADELRITDVELIATQKTIFKEYVCPQRDGEHYYSSCSFPLYDEKEKFYAIGSFYTDTTSVKEAKVALEKNNRKMQSFINGLSSLVNTSLDVICVIDAEGYFTQISSNCEKLLGYTSEELIGRKYIDFVHKDDIERSIEIAALVMRGSVVTDFENCYLTKDNKWTPVLWVATWVDEDKLMYCFAKDATKSRQTMEQLEKSKDSLRYAQKIARLGNWELNLRTKQLFCSEEFFQLIGVDPEEKKFTVQSFYDTMHPDDLAIFKTVSAKKFTADAAWNIDIRIIRPDGQIVNINLIRQRIVDKINKTIYLKGTIQDITQHKKEQADREAIIAELVKSNLELKQFSFITSHNLRAPLANILGISNLVDSASLDDYNKELWSMLVTSTKNLKKTVEDLTNIMVLKKNGTLQMENVNLPEVYEKVDKVFSNTLSAISGSVTTDFNCASVNFSIVYMENILITLISNAIKYRSLNRPLHVKISTEKDQCGQTILKVVDNGMGINLKRYGDRMFGLYQRFHDNTEGEGLGLFIIKTQITATGADINVESEEDKGTAFTIKIKNQQTKAIK